MQLYRGFESRERHVISLSVSYHGSALGGRKKFVVKNLSHAVCNCRKCEVWDKKVYPSHLAVLLKIQLAVYNKRDK